MKTSTAIRPAPEFVRLSGAQCLDSSKVILVAKSLLKRLQGLALLNLKDLSGEQRIRGQYQLPFRTDFVRIVLVIHISVSGEIS